MLNKKDMYLMEKSLGFFDKLSAAESKLLLDNTGSCVYKRGESIFSAAYECIGLLIVKSGELRVFILSENGKEVTLYRLGPREICILSASCVLDQITFDVHMEAEADSEVLMIHASAFAQLIEQNIYVENYSLKVTASKFSEVMWKMEQILFLNFDSRLAIFLLDEAAKTGSDRIELTHEQISKYMGSAREVVSRMMKYFENEGYVELHRGVTKILDKAALKKLL